MKYFRAEEDPTARLPKNFMAGFLEVSRQAFWLNGTSAFPVNGSVANFGITGPEFTACGIDGKVIKNRCKHVYILDSLSLPTTFLSTCLIRFSPLAAVKLRHSFRLVHLP